MSKKVWLVVSVIVSIVALGSLVFLLAKKKEKEQTKTD